MKTFNDGETIYAIGAPFKDMSTWYKHFNSDGVIRSKGDQYEMLFYSDLYETLYYGKLFAGIHKIYSHKYNDSTDIKWFDLDDKSIHAVFKLKKNVSKSKKQKRIRRPIKAENNSK